MVGSFLQEHHVSICYPAAEHYHALYNNRRQRLTTLLVYIILLAIQGVVTLIRTPRPGTRLLTDEILPRSLDHNQFVVN